MHKVKTIIPTSSTTLLRWWSVSSVRPSNDNPKDFNFKFQRLPPSNPFTQPDNMINYKTRTFGCCIFSRQKVSWHRQNFLCTKIRTSALARNISAYEGRQKYDTWWTRLAKIVAAGIYRLNYRFREVKNRIVKTERTYDLSQVFLFRCSAAPVLVRKYMR